MILDQSYWDEWFTKLTDEISRRQTLKRSSSSMSASSHTDRRLSARPDSQTSGSACIGSDVHAPTATSNMNDSIGDVHTSSMSSTMNTADTLHQAIEQELDHDSDHDHGFVIRWPSQLPGSGLQMVTCGSGSQGGDVNRQGRDVLAMNRVNLKKHLEGLNRDELVEMCMHHISHRVKAEGKLDAVIRSRKAWNQSARRLKQQLAKAKDRINELKNPGAGDDLQIKRKNCCKMNWNGLITLGLRKGIALVSANGQFPLITVSTPVMR